MYFPELVALAQRHFFDNQANADLAGVDIGYIRWMAGISRRRYILRNWSRWPVSLMAVFLLTDGIKPDQPIQILFVAPNVSMGKGVGVEDDAHHDRTARVGA